MTDANTICEVAVEAVETVKWLDETALFYTYSTIAQTLAGAFGILGAFTLFHLQSINRSLKGICSEFYNSATQVSGIIRLSFLREDWQMFSDNLNNYEKSILFYGDVTMGKEEYELLKKVFESELEYRKTIIKQIKFIIYITAVTIILSLIALPFTGKLIHYSLFSKILLGGITGLSIGCVSNYIRIVLSAVSHKSFPPTLDKDGKVIVKINRVTKAIMVVGDTLNKWFKRNKKSS